jgi:hypothetical protein
MRFVWRRAWVFDRLTGETRFVLENPNPQKLPPLFISGRFGGMVAANANVIAVGARLDDTSDLEDSGTVYLFDGATGALRHTLFSPHATTGHEFGFSLAVAGDGNVLAGSPATSVLAIQGAGHAYLFDGLTGNLLLDISNPEPSAFASFGWSVASIDNHLAVGDLRGNVYVFESIPEPSTLALSGLHLCAAVALWRIRSLSAKRRCTGQRE